MKLEDIFISEMARGKARGGLQINTKEFQKNHMEFGSHSNNKNSARPSQLAKIAEKKRKKKIEEGLIGRGQAVERRPTTKKTELKNKEKYPTYGSMLSDIKSITADRDDYEKGSYEWASLDIQIKKLKKMVASGKR